LGLDLISYSTEIESLLSTLQPYINDQGIFLLNYYFEGTQQDNYVFNSKFEQFIYNKSFVNNIIKKCGWNIVKEEVIEVKNEEYSQVTLILKINHAPDS
jgi:predicted TPR repeat methyltransferase